MSNMRRRGMLVQLDRELGGKPCRKVGVLLGESRRRPGVWRLAVWSESAGQWSNPRLEQDGEVVGPAPVSWLQTAHALRALQNHGVP